MTNNREYAESPTAFEVDESNKPAPKIADGTEIIMLASSIKEAKQLAFEGYGLNVTYHSPYRYASRGNNFYKFIYKAI